MNFDLETIILVLLILNAINTGLIAYNGQDIYSQLKNPDYNRYFKIIIGLSGTYSAYKLIKENYNLTK